MAFKTYRPNKKNVSKKVLRAYSKKIMRELGFVKNADGKYERAVSKN